MSVHRPSRRGLLKAAGGLTAGLAVTAGGLITAGSASAGEERKGSSAKQRSTVADAAGLKVIEANEDDSHMWFYRFETDAIGWNPYVNVLVPDGYRDNGRRYPVLYLFHGGGVGQDFISWDRAGIRELAARKEIIIVMPDGGPAGWYCNPVHSNAGPRNWETFHMAQLLPWIDANFRTHAEFDGRAVSGFSMGGFGALKYAAKYYGHFASVSAHSGPANLRGSGDLVTHWANASSAAVELAGGTVYGVPWDQARVSADNPMENVERYRGKRVFMIAGDSPAPFDPFDQITERAVLTTQNDFKGALDGAGIAHESHAVGGGHVIRGDFFARDLDGIIGRLRKAG
ncbi:esterase family protein [Streptomyces sp. XM4193]|uniref:alpha/beta hydrolase n=1 Tax=Streptomyces sp. XM4193 TaxID=2929782 RepID=UPI001FF989A0|nr:alpha/beta hydrolase-fold protein [Streptomyces sp. XM4193]MCK1795008.1 esterase family protein [Streptomyces sp. XM4193]